MRINLKRLEENKEKAIKLAKEKILEKACENCKNWKRENEEIGLCKRDKQKSFFFFSCSKFIQRKVNNIGVSQ